MRKKIVVVGGGNGSAYTIEALKRYKESIVLSAVIAMSDSGGSSGKLREEFQTLPPGDIMRAVLALSEYPTEILRQIFYKNRFNNVGKLSGHNLGNLFVVLCEQYGGDFMLGLRALEQAVQAVGHVYPATLTQTQLIAQLSDDSLVTGESNIDVPSYDRSLSIKKVWLEPAGVVCPDTATVLQEADYIIFGPGDLYTSIIPPLLPGGANEAVAASHAELIYVAGNKYTLDGETGPTHLSGFVAELESYLPRPLDVVVFNSHTPSPAEELFYANKKWARKVYDKAALSHRAVIAKDYERPGGGLSPDKLGKILADIISLS